MEEATVQTIKAMATNARGVQAHIEFWHDDADLAYHAGKRRWRIKVSVHIHSTLLLSAVRVETVHTRMRIRNTHMPRLGMLGPRHQEYSKVQPGHCVLLGHDENDTYISF